MSNPARAAPTRPGAETHAGRTNPQHRTAEAQGGRANRGRAGRRARSDDAETRDEILAAARATFGERGFAGATVRDIAMRASVNPALVLYYFGSKQRLFVAAMQLPAELSAVVPVLVDGPREEVGERLARFVLGLWDGPAGRSLVLGLVRSATTDPVAAGMLRDLLLEGPVLAVARAIDRPDAPLRAMLCGSQLIGLALARYVLAIDPVASVSTESLVRQIAPTLQRYLTDDLGEVDGLSRARRLPTSDAND